ncbi:MAG: pentapeptide repeat-containing protein, partial [Bacteroidota bacterium]
FSQEHNIIFSKSDFLVMVSEDEHFSETFYATDFESYLEFLIAGKGLISRRCFFYKKEAVEISNHFSKISTPKSFWTLQRALQLDQALLKNQFPFCDQVRFSQSQINRNSLRLVVENGEQLSQDDLGEIIENHHQFLMAGGVRGEWKVLEIRGIVTAFYHQQKETQAGVQANFERKNLSASNFESVALPYSNCCAIFAEGVSFSNSNFTGSLFTDAFLENANFCNSNFTSVDFSRSDLRNANFKNANLTHVDFENCDLRGASFEGAKLDAANFVGCILVD